MYIDERERNPEQRAFSMALYIITAAAGIFQMFGDVGPIVLSIIVGIIAWFMVKAQRISARDTIYASHVEWTARTISIGSTILFPLALTIAAYILWHDLDIASLKQKLGDDDTGIAMKSLQNFIETNTGKIMHVTDMASIPPTLWWVRRCWFGFMRAREAIPIDYPDSII